MIKLRLDSGKLRAWNGKEEEWATEAAAGWSPLEMMEGALAFCVAKSLKTVMSRNGMESDTLEILIQSKKAESGASRVEQFQVQVTLSPDLSRDDQEKLLKQVAMICTIGNTLKRESQISYQLS